MLKKTCDIKININSYISQQLSHGHNQMHLRNNACYVIVKMFIILIIILIIHNLCISLISVNVMRFKESSTSFRIGKCSQVPTIFTVCGLTVEKRNIDHNFIRLFLMFRKHTKIETVCKLFLKSLINLHVIIIITRNKDITVYSTSIHLTPVRYQ